jgi:hypothetical protein
MEDDLNFVEERKTTCKWNKKQKNVKTMVVAPLRVT